MQNYDKTQTIQYTDGGYRVYYTFDRYLHRTDGPAIIHYYADDSIEGEEYFKRNMRHREDGPALIWYSTDGLPEIEEYYLNHRIHREDGPAVIWYNLEGGVMRERYFLHGIPLRKF